jgi:membrane protease YdiL (CAAX protease family)
MSRAQIVIPVILTGFLVCLSLPANQHIPGNWNHPWLSYLVYPVLILLLIRKNPIRNGLGFGDWRKGLWLSLLASVAVLFTSFFVAKVPAVQGYYSAPRWGAGDPGPIAVAEWNRICQLLRWEFMFRGFLLFPLYEYLGPVANLIQGTLCAVTHLKKPLVEFYGSFPFALFLGYLARKTGSIWYGVYLHWLLGFSLEAYIAIGRHGLSPFF